MGLIENVIVVSLTCLSMPNRIKTIVLAIINKNKAKSAQLAYFQSRLIEPTNGSYFSSHCFAGLFNLSNIMALNSDNS
ncbi:hypothetical protein A3Q34_12515 [Colwellia sp. PAMC 20917]|nr:hypothetical protein A3Q34_12515 [Colwellia sp. PAMC 20917]